MKTKQYMQDTIDKRLAIPSYEITISTEKIKRQSGFECPDFSNITPKGKYPNFTVFDTETTGLAGTKDRIVELAAIRFRDYKPVERFSTYINPGREIPEEVTYINHITNDMVKDAPMINEVLPSFDEFIGEDLLVAHNLEFDLKFIYYSGSTVLNKTRKYIDTLEQSQKLLKKAKVDEFGEINYDKDFDVVNHKLDTLCDYYHILLPKAHSALMDAFATGQLFIKLIEDKQDMSYPLMDWNYWK